MDLLPTLRILLDHRRWVAAALVLGVAVAVLATYRVEAGLPPSLHDRRQHVGVASVDVLIDTPRSQAAYLGPATDPDTVGARSTLLAAWLATPAARARVARHARIPVGELATDAVRIAPLAPSQVALHAGALGPPAARYRLTVSRGAEPSLLHVVAESPDAATAARLARAAGGGLAEDVRAVAVRQGVPARRRAVIRVLGAAAAAERVQGHGRAVGALAGLLALGASCVALVLVVGVARRQPRPRLLATTRRP